MQISIMFPFLCRFFAPAGGAAAPPAPSNGSGPVVVLGWGAGWAARYGAAFSPRPHCPPLRGAASARCPL